MKELVWIRHGPRLARVCILSGEETKDGQNMFRQKDRKENEIPGPTENVLCLFPMNYFWNIYSKVYPGEYSRFLNRILEEYWHNVGLVYSSPSILVLS